MANDQGRAPTSSDPSERQYLLAKLEEIRKDCQWLVGVGAAGVFGVVVGNDVGTGGARRVAFALVAAQMLVALAGATSLLRQRVDRAEVAAQLRRTLFARYSLRNLSLLLLAGAFVYLGASVLF